MINYVYAMIADNGNVKVGYSRVPHFRRKCVEREHGVAIVSMVGRKGDDRDEYMLHKMFSEQALGREWFKNEGPVCVFIASCHEIPQQEITAIRGWREAAGLTQVAVAKELGVTKSTVCHWEMGESLVSPKYIHQLHRVIGIPLAEMRPDIFGAAA